MPITISINIYGEVEATDLATIAALVRQPPEQPTTLNSGSEQAKPAPEPKTIADKPTSKKVTEAKVAAEPKAEEPKAESEEKPAPAAGEDKIALLKSLALKFAQKNGREALVALFAEFGASNPSTVPADQTDAVIARLQE